MAERGPNQYLKRGCEEDGVGLSSVGGLDWVIPRGPSSPCHSVFLCFLARQGGCSCKRQNQMFTLCLLLLTNRKVHLMCLLG